MSAQRFPQNYVPSKLGGVQTDRQISHLTGDEFHSNSQLQRMGFNYKANFHHAVEDLNGVSELRRTESDGAYDAERSIRLKMDGKRRAPHHVRAVSEEIIHSPSLGIILLESRSQPYLAGAFKLKFLCSFGGKFLPRPSDGKLRYVGGETRIISIGRDLSWAELIQKTRRICNQSFTIKYQLPGEDLDALISVSSDEDLQNMLEEYLGLDTTDGSQRIRLFLIATNDSENSSFEMSSPQTSPEDEYVAAVNGISPGKSSSGDSYKQVDLAYNDLQVPTGIGFKQVSLSPPSSPRKLLHRDFTSRGNRLKEDTDFSFGVALNHANFNNRRDRPVLEETTLFSDMGVAQNADNGSIYLGEGSQPPATLFKPQFIQRVGKDFVEDPTVLENKETNTFHHHELELKNYNAPQLFMDDFSSKIGGRVAPSRGPDLSSQELEELERSAAPSFFLGSRSSTFLKDQSSSLSKKLNGDVECNTEISVGKDCNSGKSFPEQATVCHRKDESSKETSDLISYFDPGQDVRFPHLKGDFSSALDPNTIDDYREIKTEMGKNDPIIELISVEDVTTCEPLDCPMSPAIVPRVTHLLTLDAEKYHTSSTNLDYENEEANAGTVHESISGAVIAEIEAGIYGLQIIKNADLEELRELGSGTFGTVYHGKWRGTDVAIKRIRKSCFSGKASEQDRLTKDFWREAQILSRLHHPNVVAFYGVVPDGAGGTLATVTEYMINGSLKRVLSRKDRILDRRRRLMIATDAAFGMEYLHSKNIVHFDLKCDNLLVNTRDPHRPICKVGDFGLSRIKRNTLLSGGVRGTLPWMAPELLNGSSNKVCEKVDVFSFGIALWEILTGEEPYARMHCGAIIGGIVSHTLRPPIPDDCDFEWRRLMEQCWSPDPSARPSFTEVAHRLRSMSTPPHPRRS
ncbi:PB1 domain-containing protein tyrosine kinase [Wolffia australiana]